MSNKSVSLKFFETYAGQRDVEGCGPLFAENATIYTTVAPSPMNFQAYRQVGYAFLAGFADLSATVIEQLEDGNKVISRVSWSGTQTGPLNGIPPAGRAFRTESIVIDTVANGQIVERREVSDMLGMLQQLGVIPAPQAA
jgi:predicted ester cyclase